MATYDAGRADASTDLNSQLGSYLAQQILNALDAGSQGQAETISVQTDWTPGTAIEPGTGILVAAPGSISGNVEIPEGISALLLTGATGVQAVFDVNDTVSIVLTDGADTVSIDDSGLALGETVTLSGGGGNDVIVGAASHSNNIIGGLGDDTMSGGTLNDAFDVGQGNDTVDAGAGFDQAFIRGSINDYTQTFSDGVLTLVNKATGDTTVLKDLEYLHFSDGGVVVNVTTDAGFAAASLYDIILGRDPDAAGLEFYADKSGEELIDIANGMLGSDEFTAAHGDVDALSPEAFLDILYEQAFDRGADDAGEQYWLEKLASGMSYGEVAVRFAYTVEAQKEFDGMINFDHDDQSV